ncbi:MAG: hypothetical protein A2Z29_03725 [Chloroflexi bacterium RBG_16_56_11]|nr:MAG: hypothetical protein A2Z29_03725 [Chloroflexi bacterium RBG_16_56_11]
MLLVGVILFAGLVYLAYSLMTHAGSGALTVSGVKQITGTLGDLQIKVEGKVAPGSIKWNGESKTLDFVLTDGQENLDVVYNGVVPDEFTPGTELVVTGRYDTGDAFQATDFGKPASWCSVCH